MNNVLKGTNTVSTSTCNNLIGLHREYVCTAGVFVCERILYICTRFIIYSSEGLILPGVVSSLHVCTGPYYVTKTMTCLMNV